MVRAGGAAFVGGFLLALTVVYLIANFMLTTNQIILVLRAMIVAMGIGIAVAYYREFLEIARKPERPLSGGDHLALGTMFFVSSMVGLSTWSLIYRLTGFPEWMRNTDVTAFFLVQAVIGAFFFLTATTPDHVLERSPRRNQKKAGVIIALFAFLAILVGLSTEAAPYVAPVLGLITGGP